MPATAALAAAIRKLAAAPDTCREMGTAGRAHVAAHFDRHVLAEKLLTLMKRLIRKNP